MKQRNIFAILALTIVTFGIYQLVWFVKTKNEMNQRGAAIPTAWLIIIPFVSIWWLWKYSEGVQRVTNGSMSGPMAFVLLWLVGVIGAMIIQNTFNSLSTGAAVPQAGATPAFTPPVAEPQIPVVGASPMQQPPSSVRPMGNDGVQNVPSQPVDPVQNSGFTQPQPDPQNNQPQP